MGKILFKKAQGFQEKELISSCGLGNSAPFVIHFCFTLFLRLNLPPMLKV